MVLKIIRWTKGYVEFSLITKSPERFINLCSINGVRLWNTRPKEYGLVSCMSAADYKRIRRLTKKSKSHSKIRVKSGLPFFIRKYRARWGVAAGCLLFAGLSFFLSSFIWTINIIGTEELSQSRVLEALSDNGLSVGTLKAGMNLQQIQRNMIIELPQIGWMSINVLNSCANIEIKEKAPVPQMNDDFSPCSIVASSDGVITDYKVSEGKVEVMRGSAVVKGQMLVNSVKEDQLGGVEFSHASAEIYADVEQTKSFSVNTENVLLLPTGRFTDRYAVNFFNLCIPATAVYSGYDDSYLQKDSYRVFWGNNYLPVGTDRQREIEYDRIQVNLSEEQANTALKKEMALYEVFCKNESRVVSRGFSGGCSNGKYTLNVNYVFNENIAESKELYITE